ncbi:MAG: porin [Pseudomonadota bacterium]
MIGGLKKASLYLFAGASAFAILASTAPAANAQYITRAEFEEYKKSQPKVEWKGAPKISSHDGKFSFKVRGRLQVDYNAIDQDERITGEDDINSWEARRARLGVEGKVFYDWKYKFEIDFADNEVDFKDAYISYAGFSDWNNLEILFGQFKIANSLEGQTSSRFITFMERGFLVNAFELEPRALGIGLHAGSNDDFGWSFQTSYNGPDIGNGGDWDEAPSIWAIRATVAPVNTDDAIVHLGASYRQRDNGTLRDDNVTDLYRYRSRVGLHLSDRFVDTGSLAESDDYWGIEGAVAWNRFSVQGEYGETTADLPGNLDGSMPRGISPTYDGWYIFGSIFLTDDSRASGYSARKGEFGRVKPTNPFDLKNGGWGAWEIAGRWSELNLGSDAAQLAEATGDDFCDATPAAEGGGDGCGSQEGWTIALNWYPTNYTRLMFNVIGTDVGGTFNGFRGADISGFGMRGQIDW